MKKLSAFFFFFFFISSALMAGNTFPLLAHLDKQPPFEKPLIVNIWATWCAPCVKEMPELEQLAKEGDYHVYALSIDRKFSVAERFWQRGGYQYMQMAHDVSGKSFFKHYSGEAVPVTFILNTQGVVVGVEKGIRAWAHDDMKKKIQHHLK